MIKKFGILGGGQLGRMIALSMHNYGFLPCIFSDTPNSPAFAVTNHYIHAQYDDLNKLEDFAKYVNVLTFEFENLPYNALQVLEKYTHVMPNKNILKITQNRILEKAFLVEMGIGIANYTVIDNYKESQNVTFNYPAIIKTASFGYDGKGQKTLHSASEIPQDFNFPAVLEEVVDFSKEISIVAAREKNGRISFFPIAENIHKNGILISSKVPADIPANVKKQVLEIAEHISISIALEGLLAIELFLTTKNALLVNELAPRVHNSCHWSIDSCNISQFDALVMIMSGLALPKINLQHPCMMHNIIGDDINNAFSYIKNENAKLHIYGKEKISPGRKMGHVNILL